MKKHTDHEARSLLKDGESTCNCHACHNLREGLALWIAGSELSPTYTEAEAAEDFWTELEAVDPLLTNSQ